MRRSDISFDVLHKEMDILSDEQLKTFLGGYGGDGGGTSVPQTPDTGTPITDYLSAFFGRTVTSSQDAMGNWMISIGGAPPIQLTFDLNEVQITSTGQVKNQSGAVIENNWDDWIPAGYGGGGTNGSSGGVGGNGGAGAGGGGGILPVGASGYDIAYNAIYNGLAMNEFYTTLDAARLGTISIDANSLIQNVFEGNLPNAIMKDLMAAKELNGIALLSTTGRVLGITTAVGSLSTLFADLMDNDGHVSMLNVADAAINVGSLFIKSNLVGATVSMGWLLIRGEFE